MDSAVTDFLSDEGYSGEDKRLHRIGHGIGLGTHEGPWLAEGSVDRLGANMVISIEPGIYLKGIGGFRHSDTYVVTEGGYNLLTNYRSDLESLLRTGSLLNAVGDGCFGSSFNSGIAVLLLEDD